MSDKGCRLVTWWSFASASESDRALWRSTAPWDTRSLLEFSFVGAAFLGSSLASDLDKDMSRFVHLEETQPHDVPHELPAALHSHRSLHNELLLHEQQTSAVGMVLERLLVFEFRFPRGFLSDATQSTSSSFASSMSLRSDSEVSMSSNKAKELRGPYFLYKRWYTLQLVYHSSAQQNNWRNKLWSFTLLVRRWYLCRPSSATCIEANLC